MSEFKCFIEIKDFEGEALKSQGKGSLRYRLYFDENFKLFVQIEKNELSVRKPGTHSDLLFPLNKYASASLLDEKLSLPIVGRTLDGKAANSTDGNMSGFLKAVIRDLLREE